MGMIQLPQLQESLLIANDRLVDRARRRARLFRMGMLSSAAVISVGGAAVAGQELWGPVLGSEDGNRPSASSTPVPAGQAALIGALRREQTPIDRGAVARRALASATSRYVGVRLDAVRVVLRTAGGGGIAVIPVADLRPANGRVGPGDDVLCVSTVLGGGAGELAVNCFGTDDVRAGRATGALGSLVWGLVPDGVRRVTVPGSDGRPLEVLVRDNVFSLPAAQVGGPEPAVTWLDDADRTVVPDGGAPMLLRLAPSGGGPVPDGFHDCGTADGGIVPETVRCGAPSRRWEPGIGSATPAPDQP
jgi:hypothetical protein